MIIHILIKDHNCKYKRKQFFLHLGDSESSHSFPSFRFNKVLNKNSDTETKAIIIDSILSLTIYFDICNISSASYRARIFHKASTTDYTAYNVTLYFLDMKQIQFSMFLYFLFLRFSYFHIIFTIVLHHSQPFYIVAFNNIKNTKETI